MEGPNQINKYAKFYPLETGLKFIFIIMAIGNMNYTITVGFVASLLGLLRMLKTIQFTKQYLQRALMNAHGQNILYIGMGSIGYVNFLFYAPLILYFSYALVQFYNQKFPGDKAHQKLKPYIDTIRNNRFWVMEGKARIQIFFFFYLLLTIPIDISRILKCFMMAQYNLLKYRATPETRTAATNINNWILNKISGIGFLSTGYKKLIDWIYKIATNIGQ